MRDQEDEEETQARLSQKRIHAAEVNNILMTKMMVLTLMQKNFFFQVRNQEDEEQTNARLSQMRIHAAEVNNILMTKMMVLTLM